LVCQGRFRLVWPFFEIDRQTRAEPLHRGGF
jgi:hypothetical protein